MTFRVVLPSYGLMCPFLGPRISQGQHHGILLNGRESIRRQPYKRNNLECWVVAACSRYRA